MDEFIDTLKEKIINSLSGYPLDEQAFIITALADKLLDERSELLTREYSQTNNEE